MEREVESRTTRIRLPVDEGRADVRVARRPRMRAEIARSAELSDDGRDMVADKVVAEGDEDGESKEKR